MKKVKVKWSFSDISLVQWDCILDTADRPKLLFHSSNIPRIEYFIVLVFQYSKDSIFHCFNILIFQGFNAFEVEIWIEALSLIRLTVDRKLDGNPSDSEIGKKTQFLRCSRSNFPQSRLHHAGNSLSPKERKTFPFPIWTSIREIAEIVWNYNGLNSLLTSTAGFVLVL